MSTKTLGPFTGRQLTVIIVALIIAVAVPTAASGFTVGHTAITDATSKTTASVTPGGQLLTSPASPFNYFISTLRYVSGGSGSVQFYAPPSGQAGIVTNVQVDSFALSGSDPYEYLTVQTAGCGSIIASVNEVDPSSNGLTNLPFSPGLVIPAGDVLTAYSSNTAAAVVASGYTVPAADAPTLPLARVQAPRRP